MAKKKRLQKKREKKEEKALPITRDLLKALKVLAEAHGEVGSLCQYANEQISNFVDKHGDKAMETILSGLFALKKTGEFPEDQFFYIILDVMIEVIKKRGLAKFEHTNRMAQMLGWDEISRDFSVSRRFLRLIEKLNPSLAIEAKLRLEKADRERKPENFKVDIEAIIAKLKGGGCEAVAP